MSRGAITDDSRYVISDADLAFLDLTAQQIEDWESRTALLGMTSGQYEDFCSSLIDALKRDALGECDLRVVGSSACFWAGVHKEMVYEKEDIFQEARKVREPGDFVDGDALDAMCAKLLGQWPDGRERPRRRPFNVYHRCGVHPDPSDYDVHVSSTELVDRARMLLSDMGLPTEGHLITHPTYQFIRKDLIARAAPRLWRWAAEQRRRLLRPVSVSVFGSSGPPNMLGKNPDHPALSAHFREDDWRIAWPVS